LSTNVLIIAAALVLVAAIAAFAYIQTRPKRTLLDQLGGASGIVSAAAALA